MIFSILKRKKTEWDIFWIIKVNDMRFFDYFYITVFAVLILFTGYYIIIKIVNLQRIKKISRKIAVRKSFSYNIYWIVLCAINSFLKFDSYRMALEINDAYGARKNFLAFLAWASFGILYFAMIFLDKYMYITPNGLVFNTSIKISPKENYSYKFEDDTLELYFKQSYKPAKYKIVENKNELIELLAEYYVPYSEKI